MIYVAITFGLFFGFIVKQIINWLKIDDFIIENKNPSIEIISILLSIWGFMNLELSVAIPFTLISIILIGISFVDFKTFQVPLIFILMGILVTIVNIYIENIYINAALWGVFIGSIIPLAILGIMWVITKRQGMGFGDIQLGVVLGAWLGPMRMALTLFFASLLSLLTWIAVSIFKGFDRDRALPMVPFLTIAALGVYIGSFYYPDFFYLLIMQ